MDQARLLAAYRRWAPIYDLLIGPLARRTRRRVVDALELGPGERLVIPGCGTGLDLPLLPAGVRAVALDLSPEMLERARRKRSRAEVELRVGDAMALDLPDASFDAALLNLIVAVAPDGARVIREALRVLRPGGRMVIFDKFLPDDREPGPLRRRVGALADRLGTDINRRLGDLLGAARDLVASEEPVPAPFRLVVLRKPARTPILTTDEEAHREGKQEPGFLDVTGDQRAALVGETAVTLNVNADGFWTGGVGAIIRA